MSEDKAVEKIFIVDDSPTLRSLVVHFVQQAGCIPVPFEDGIQALNGLNTHWPSLILMDFEMPQVQGDECCRRIKAQRAFAHVPIVMMTTCHGPEQIESWWRAGADDFLPKPIVKAQLDAKIAAVRQYGPNRLAHASQQKSSGAASGMLQKIVSDLRGSQRLPFFSMVQFRRRGESDWQTGFTTDLSAGGMCLRTLTPYEPATEVEIRLTLAKNQRPCAGMVAWSDPVLERSQAAGMGIAFTQLDAEAQREIAQILKARPNAAASGQAPAASLARPLTPQSGSAANARSSSVPGLLNSSLVNP